MYINHSLPYLRVNPCGRLAVTEFAVLQQKALQLSKKIADSYGCQAGCYSFFDQIIPKIIRSNALDDAILIGHMARTLFEENDTLLFEFCSKIECGVLKIEDLEAFKNKILNGIYLMTWAQYNGVVSTYLNNKLIECIRNDLEIEPQIQSFDEVDRNLINSSLSALGVYCSFIFSQQENKLFGQLNKMLGDSIQLKIHMVQHQTKVSEYNWDNIYSGIIGSLGLN